MGWLCMCWAALRPVDWLVGSCRDAHASTNAARFDAATLPFMGCDLHGAFLRCCMFMRECGWPLSKGQAWLAVMYVHCMQHAAVA